ncbi:hypothetical protein MP228_006039 [Amoeboaphelidium protococcarum]|nr:hypothetical protein MP228_006039 [Amoeboaphelidium protococcarum]
MPIILRSTEDTSAERPQIVTQQSYKISQVPLGTRLLLIVCSSLFILQTVVPAIDTDVDLTFKMCLSPYNIGKHGSVWRLFTFSYAHANIIHFAMNMISLVMLGSLIEKRYGTLVYMHLVFSLSTLAGILHTFIVWMVVVSGAITQNNHWLQGECVVGISGVLFSFLFIEMKTHPEQDRRLFGLFSLPAKYYPVALLLFIQILFPGSSFIGHACGIAAGYSVALLEAQFLYPWFLRKLEEHPWLKDSQLSQNSAYVKMPDVPLSPGGHARAVYLNADRNSEQSDPILKMNNNTSA